MHMLHLVSKQKQVGVLEFNPHFICVLLSNNEAFDQTQLQLQKNLAPQTALT